VTNLFDVFEQVDVKFRMLCIDSVFVGCCLYKEGRKKAGEKLILTALEPLVPDSGELLAEIIGDIDGALASLRAHREIQELNPAKK